MKRILSLLLCILLLFSLGAYPSSAKAGCTVTLSKKSYSYNGKVRTPSVTVKIGSKTLKKGTDYTVTYPSGRKNVGSYTVTVKMKGNYSGKRTASFKIVPVIPEITSLKGGQKSVSVKWNKNTAQTSGYILRYSTGKSFSKYQSVTFDSSGTSHCKISSLKASAKYFIQIRAYKTVGAKTYYSAWSDTLSFSTKSEAEKTGVYITPTGKCYHFSKSCAGKNAKTATYAFASANYRPCKNCVR